MNSMDMAYLEVSVDTQLEKLQLISVEIRRDLSDLVFFHGLWKVELQARLSSGHFRVLGVTKSAESVARISYRWKYLKIRSCSKISESPDDNVVTMEQVIWQSRSDTFTPPPRQKTLFWQLR